MLDEDAAAIGWSGFAHRRFLADFYAGKFPGSFARGEVFQDNPVIGDRRTSGTMASLAGLEDALAAGDPGLVELAGRRVEPGTVSQRLFSGLAALAAARRRTPQLHAATLVEVADLQQPQLFAFLRRHPLGALVAVHNVTEQAPAGQPMALYLVGHDQPVGRISGQAARVEHGQVVLDPTRRSGSPPPR